MPGGFLIRPEEIDEVLRQHPSVVEAVTVAMPDETFGEVPVSAVVLDGAADERELTALARSRLEPLKVPKRILAVDAIPRGPSGKPHLDALTARLREALAALDRGRPAASTPLDHERAVIETAAEVFRVDPASLSMRSTPRDVAGWDSFSQLSLLVALEGRFGVRLHSSRAAAIRSLSDALTAVLAASR